MDKNKKQKRYERLYKQIEALIIPENGLVANMATIAAVLYHKMDYYFWCGFYLLRKGELIVGPYQGPVACQLLKKGTGVCWAGLNQQKTLVVPDVEKFPGHIACDSRSKSEIVIPVYNANDEIIGVLDIDSKDLASFNEIDALMLDKITALLKPISE